MKYRENNNINFNVELIEFLLNVYKLVLNIIRIIRFGFFTFSVLLSTWKRTN